MSSKVLYLSGPMSNIPQYNIPLFDAVAAALRKDGYTIINPAEEDSPEVRAAGLASKDGKPDAAGKVGDETWGDMLAWDVKLLADGYSTEDHARLLPVEGIALLPDWEKSRGARLEAFVGLLTGKEYYRVLHHQDRAGDTYALQSATSEWVEHMLAGTWNGVKVYRTGAE